MQTKEEHLQAAEKLDSYASKLNDGPYKAKVLGAAEKHRRQSTRKGSLFGKVLGLTFALTIALLGLFVASRGLGQTDPLAWALIAGGLAVFGMGVCLTMMWKDAQSA